MESRFRLSREVILNWTVTTKTISKKNRVYGFCSDSIIWQRYCPFIYLNWLTLLRLQSKNHWTFINQWRWQQNRILKERFCSLEQYARDLRTLSIKFFRLPRSTMIQLLSVKNCMLDICQSFWSSKAPVCNLSSKARNDIMVFSLLFIGAVWAFLGSPSEEDQNCAKTRRKWSESLPIIQAVIALL